ncbi:protein borderless isoform X2 [Harmonia axyridis]|uniref:protein borderless isoform X2 n=1 Tax=Harmonia axyridis TaxID=115357 RepID=UPI001E27906C|nr:protein borderless isoform X2 [Harmonia axyridis]
MRRTWCFLLIGLFLGVSGFEYGENEKEPVYLTATIGGWVVLSCDVDFPESMPIPFKLYWNKDQRTIFTYHKGVITSNEPYVGRLNLVEHPHPRYDIVTVNLTSIRESDDGWFQCKVNFPNRTPSRRNRNGTWFHLSVNGGNLLEIPPINQTVLEEEEARLTCLPKDNEMRVVWYKDRVPIKDYPHMVHRSWTELDGTLVIKPTHMEDYGEYECEVIHASGERQSARAFLDIQYKAKVIYAPPEIHLPYGRQAIIDCHVKANPPLKNLNWEKDGFLYDPYNIPGVFYKKNGSLLISKVDDSHNGRYTCTPFNKLGTQGPSSPMQVIVQKPPVFLSRPNNMYIKKLGELIEIPCQAKDGENGHKPIIVWYKKDGTSLPTGRTEIKNGNLSIYNLQEEDRGLYVCSVTNKASTITAETELLVETIPSSAPYNLTGISTAHGVYLKWWAGRQRTNVNYSIWYKPVESKEWKTYDVPPSSYLDATIENLDPGREYEFMVLCRDELGEGLFSKAVRLWTRKSNGDELPTTPENSFIPPVGFPRNVTVIPAYKGFQVSWLPPEYGLENLKFYVVRCTQGVEEYPLLSYETRNTSHIISDLPEGNQYGIQIIAVSYDDQQAVSEKVGMNIPEYRKSFQYSTT